METTSLTLLPGENIVAGIHNLPGHFQLKAVDQATRTIVCLCLCCIQ